MEARNCKSYLLPRSDGNCKRGMREESKEHCMIQAMDQLASEGALDGKSVGSVIN